MLSPKRERQLDGNENRHRLAEACTRRETPLLGRLDGFLIETEGGIKRANHLHVTDGPVRADDAFKQQTPAFANATRTACSLLVPSTQPDSLLGELTRLMGRKADKSWQEGNMHVHAWTHQQADALSHVHYYAPDKAGAQAVLSASVFFKH